MGLKRQTPWARRSRRTVVKLCGLRGAGIACLIFSSVGWAGRWVPSSACTLASAARSVSSLRRTLRSCTSSRTLLHRAGCVRGSSPALNAFTMRQTVYGFARIKGSLPSADKLHTLPSHWAFRTSATINPRLKSFTRCPRASSFAFLSTPRFLGLPPTFFPSLIFPFCTIGLNKKIAKVTKCKYQTGWLNCLKKNVTSHNGSTPKLSLWPN
jgi:hypothetical protein